MSHQWKLTINPPIFKSLYIFFPQIIGCIFFLFFNSTPKNKGVFLLSKNRNILHGRGSTGKVIKMSTESSNYESVEEKVWNFIFDSAEPKWQPVSSWKNNEPGMLAHHFRSSMFLWLDRSSVRPIHAPPAEVLLFLENSESYSIMAPL